MGRRSVKDYKKLKNLKKQNLRDSMTNLELVLNMLAEASTTEISKKKQPAILVLSFLLQEMSFAYPDLKTLISDNDPSKASKAWALKYLPAIPESVAMVEDAYQANNPGATIILLQDTHTNDSGQINLAKTLDLILKNQKNSFVFVEGGFGNDSPVIFKRQGQPFRPQKSRDVLS